MSHQIDKNLINKSEVARRIGISQPYISLILSGQRTGPKAQQILKRIKEEIKTTRKAA
jgi:transcriptional regulator with XRE-family HTH domain